MIRDQRSQGRQAILSEIRRAGSVARVDLAQRTGLSQATVTAITAELLAAGLIEETPGSASPADGRRGRPRVGLRLCGRAHLVAGVKVADRSLSVAMVDFAGVVLAEASAPLVTRVLTGPELSRAILAVATRAATEAGRSLKDITGLGIGLAGIVDAAQGLVHWSPALSQRNTPLRDDLAAAAGVPVFIDNDANLVAMAELYFGEGKGIDDFLVVTVESGVGLGVVIGGRVYRGTRGCGAEFGHMKVQIDGALCRCGQRGCLEAYVADYALLREAALKPGFSTGDPRRDLVQLLALARAGDPMAASIVGRAGRFFAMGLANLVNIFDPQLIILAGEMAQLDHFYGRDVLAAVQDLVVQVDVAPPELVVHRWSDLMWARGAAAYALDGLAFMALEAMGDNAA